MYNCRARQTQVPECPGHLKIVVGHSEKKRTCPIGQCHFWQWSIDKNNLRLDQSSCNAVCLTIHQVIAKIFLRTLLDLLSSALWWQNGQCMHAKHPYACPSRTPARDQPAPFLLQWSLLRTYAHKFRICTCSYPRMFWFAVEFFSLGYNFMVEKFGHLVFAVGHLNFQCKCQLGRQKYIFLSRPGYETIIQITV